MANKAAIDFGNSNTAAAVWNEKTQSAEILRVPEFSADDSFLIPSEISYEPDGRFYVGAQAAREASESAKCFRWMKRYIALRSPYTLRIGEERIDAYRAAEDFLHAVLASVFAASGEKPDEAVISVPVESFEHYSEWLSGGLRTFENTRVRLVDEASAAAAGYGARLRPGDSLLVVDFGGSTLQAVCVSVTEEARDGGRCCRVLGKAGMNLGGMTLDRWIFEDALGRLGLSENDPRVRSCSGDLLRYCEEFKRKLSDAETAGFDFFPGTGFTMTRLELSGLFEAHGLTASLDRTAEEALRAAEDHGLRRDELTAVIPVGGSCLIPLIRERLESLFSAEKVFRGEPLGAVARGAAVIAGGMHIYDFIQHDYAIRTTDPLTGEYVFRTIIPKGTKYPAEQVGPRMKLKASYDGQTRYGIAVYELRNDAPRDESRNEIFFHADGSVRVMPLTEEESRAERMFWMNERNPLFLRSDEPGEKSVPRFEVTFGISENKMLTITASDPVSGETVLKDRPVIRLA